MWNMHIEGKYGEKETEKSNLEGSRDGLKKWNERRKDKRFGSIERCKDRGALKPRQGT